MELQLKILQFLIENNYKKFTIKEISDKLKIDYKNTHQNVKKLENSNLIILEKIGSSYQVFFNFKFNHKIYEVEQIRKEELIKDKNIKIISNILNEIRSPFFIALLFGSFVKKTNNKHSDIDLCIITDNKDTHKEIKSKLSLLPLEIDLNQFTTEEFKSMLKTKDFNVSHEIKKHYIVLNGIENYYNLIQNV